LSGVFKKITNAISRPAYAANVNVARGLKPAKEGSGDVPRITFQRQIEAYRKDTALRDFVDILAMQAVGMGFYTSCANVKDYPQAEEAKQIIDDFNERSALDNQLQVLARELVGTGNCVLQLFEPDKLERVRRVPMVSFDRIFTNEFLELEETDFTKKREIKLGLQQTTAFGGNLISPDRLRMIRWNPIDDSGWGCGLIQALMEEFTWQEWDPNTKKNVTRTRPSPLETKAKMDTDLIEIFEKWVGPVEAWVADSTELAKMIEGQLKTTPKYGGRIVVSGKNKTGALDIKTPPMDVRGRFDGIVEYLWNQFCLGGQTPLPKLLTETGFTEASSNSAIEIADRLVMPINRLIKRDIEDLWRQVLKSTAPKIDPMKAAVRLNWGTQETPTITAADLIAAAEKSLISKEDFARNAIKVLHWELTEPQPGQNSGVPSA
jgi:hypothetical protein